MQDRRPNPTELARDLDAAFPDLAPVAPLRLLDAGFGSVVVESAGGVVFRVARTQQAGRAFVQERRLLAVVAPHLPVQVPEPAWYAASLPGAPHGVVGYRKIDGAPIATDSPEPLLRTVGSQAGRFLAALHALAPDDVRGIVDTMDPQALVSREMRETVRDRLAGLVTASELDAVERWLDRFLSDAALPASGAVLCHGDLWYENLLVDAEGELRGVLDWQAGVLADPAWDFAAQFYLGRTYFESVVAGYGAADRELPRRARAYRVLRELEGLCRAERDEEDEIRDSASKILDALNAGRRPPAGRRDRWHHGDRP